MAQSIDDILAEDDALYRRVVSARLPRVPQALLDEHAELDKRLMSLADGWEGIDSPPEAADVAARLAEIEAEIDESAVVVKLAGVGHKRWADLLRDHPPTKEQKRDHPQLDHNPETFPPAAIAAAAIDPEMTVEQVGQLIAKPWFNERCWSELWSRCLEANVVADPPKSLAAGLIRRQSGGSATTALRGASRAASSLDGS